MPVLNTQKLDEQIAKRAFAPLYLLYGEESVLCGQAVARLRLALIEETGEDNLQDLSEKDFSVQMLADILDTPSFFGGKKGVVIHDVNPFDMPEAEQKKLYELLDRLPEDGVTVFSVRTEKPDERKTAVKDLLKAFSEKGAVVKFNKTKGEDVVKFVEDRIKKNGGKADRRLCGVLVNRVGEDLNTLSGEVDKLCAFTDGRPIHEEDIDAIVTETEEASVFKIASSLFAGDLAGALLKVRILLANREEPIKLLAVLSGAFIDLYRAMLARNRRKTADETVAAFSYPPKVAFKVSGAMRDAARFPAGAIRNCLLILVDADRELKSGKGDGGVILETCVVRLYAALCER